MTAEIVDAAAELVWDIRCGTGESPVWHAARGILLFADIPAGRIHGYDPVSEEKTTWKLPDVVASLGVCASGRLVVALRDQVVLYDLDRDAITPLVPPLGLPRETRFNDGKVGPDGAFWVGTMDGTKQPTAKLYRVTPDGAADARSEGYVTANGLAWSPDGQIMYHSDSRNARIDAWDFDAATGAIANRRVFATPNNDEGRPDGAATDTDGYYWSSGVSAACLNRFAPDGTHAQKFPLPVPGPTMPCFTPHGLFVTTLREGRDEATIASHPAMGGLFRLHVAATGVPVGLFDDRAAR
jgi:sugar lactone lactonase YvrE